MINDARYTREIKSRFAVAKVAFNKTTATTITKTNKQTNDDDNNNNNNNETHFCIKLDLRKKLVQCYIWSITFFMVLKLGSEIPGKF